MTIQYDKDGLIIQTLTEILNERQNNCQSFLGDDFDISGESVVGNLQTADADRELSLQEGLLYLASQLDPDQAEGIWLDYICALNNITRNQATKTKIPIIVTGSPNLSKNANDLTVVDENTDEYFTNSEPFILDAEGKATVTFEATSWGAIQALPTSTYSLKTPVYGITEVKYDTSKNTQVGVDVEDDLSLRTRRNSAVTYTASSILSSIKAAVMQISDVKYINAYENDTMQIVDTLPPKSFEIVVQGGDENVIAQAILEKKPAGIQAYGTTTKIVTDDDGNQFQIGFTRPTEAPIDLKITFVSTSSQTDEWKNDLRNELIKEFQSLYTVGDSIYVYNLYSILNAHEEIVNVTEFKAKKHSDSTWNDSVAIGKRELATLSVDNIAITQSA